MDFASLLNVAQKNTAVIGKNEPTKYYSTKFQAPKKETPKDRKLSANIQKFLQKQQEEEEAKRRDDKAKLDELLSMRDTKAKNKIRKMLKVTKSADRSVLDDSKDTDNGPPVAQPDQPDEDDYGYVSHEADQVYKKLMEKYKSSDNEGNKCATSSRPQVRGDLSGTKDRVRAAIQRERDDLNSSRRRVGGASSSSTPQPTTRAMFAGNSSTATTGTFRKRPNAYDPAEEKRAEEQRRRDERLGKMKNRPAPPPPMDFQAILELAKQKQFEPSVPVTTIEPVVRKRPEPERLLTAKERREQEDRQRAQEERERRRSALDGKPVAGRIPNKANGTSTAADGGRRPLDSKAGSAAKTNGAASAGSKPAAVRPISSSMQRPGTTDGKAKPATATSNGKSRESHISSSANVKSAVASLSTKSNRPGSSSASGSVVKSRPDDAKSGLSADSKTRQFPPADVKTRQFPPADVKSRPFPPADVKSRPFPPADVKTRQYPPADLKTRQFPPADVRTRQFPPADVRGYGGQPNRRPNAAPKRQVIDEDDSEYDSEMDDFIADDEEEPNDYSQHIKAIFGYDKSRYRNIDEDVDNMESSFAQQMKEEFISKKIGQMEDLEDMRLEAEEKKAKAKRAGKRRKIDSSDEDD